jgi:hypothetical protein
MSGGGMGGLSGYGGLSNYWGTDVEGGNGFLGLSGGTNWGETGNNTAQRSLENVAPVMGAQSNYAQGQAQKYAGMQGGALGLSAPTIAGASTKALGQTESNLSGLAGQYADVASGKGPMGQLAEDQYQQALGQSVDAQMAMAHSAPGGAIGGAGAMRAAQENAAQQTAGAAAQSGIIAAQQQQAALAGEGQTLGQLGGLDMGQYQTAQQVAEQQAALQQQQTGQNEGFFSNLGTQALNQQQLANQSVQSLGGLGVQAGLGEAGTAVGAMNANTNMVGTAANLGAAAAGAGSGAASMYSSSDAGQKMAVQSEGDAPSGLSASHPVGESTVDMSRPTDTQRMGGMMSGALSGAKTGASVGSVVPIIGTAIGAGVGAAAGGLSGYANTPNNVTGVTQGNGQFTPSDEHLKAEKVGEGDESHFSLADNFLQHIEPMSYRYKDPTIAPGGIPSTGRFLGVMAQDLEQIPEIGRQLVLDTPRGKMVNVPAGLSATMAGLGRLSERVSRLDGGKR